MATTQIVIDVDAKPAVGEFDEFQRKFATGMERLKNGAGSGFSQIQTMTSDTEKAFKSLNFSWTRVAEAMTGFSFATFLTDAIGRVKEFVTESLRLGLAAERQEDAFRRLTEFVGVSGDALASALQKASGGVVSTSNIMIAAARALQEGLQPDQMIRLMEIARQQSKLAGTDVTDAFNRITEAIATGQTRSLKQFQIVVDLTQATQDYARAQGVAVDQLNETGRTQAIVQAVFERTKGSVAALSTEVRSHDDRIQASRARWEDLKSTLGKFLVDEGFKILDWFDGLGAKATGAQTSLDGIQSFFGGLITELKKATAAFQPFVDVFVSLGSLIMRLADVLLRPALAALNIALGSLLGPLGAIGSLMADLSKGKLPDFEKAWQKNKDIAESYMGTAKDLVAPLLNLVTGNTEVAKAEEKVAAGAEMGRNKLGAMSNQIRPLILNLNDVVASMRSLTGQFEMAGFLPREGELAGLTRPVLQALEKVEQDALAKGIQLPEAWNRYREAIENWARSAAGATLVQRDLKDDQELLVKQMLEADTAFANDSRAIREWKMSQAEALEVAAGFTQGTALGIGRVNEDFKTRIDTLHKAGDALEQYNTAQNRLAIEETRNTQQIQRLQGDWFGFMASGFRAAALQIGDFWDISNRLAVNTFQSMRSGLSDFFFELESGTLNGKKLFESFLGSLKRAVADFLADSVIRGFFGLSSRGGGAGGGLLGGLLFGAGTDLTGGGGGGGLGTALQGANLTASLFGTGGGGLTGFISDLFRDPGATARAIDAGTIVPESTSLGGAGFGLSTATTSAGIIPGLANLSANFQGGGLLGTLAGLNAQQAAAGGLTGPSGGLFGSGGKLFNIFDISGRTLSSGEATAPISGAINAFLTGNATQADVIAAIASETIVGASSGAEAAALGFGGIAAGGGAGAAGGGLAAGGLATGGELALGADAASSSLGFLANLSPAFAAAGLILAPLALTGALGDFLANPFGINSTYTPYINARINAGEQIKQLPDQLDNFLLEPSRGALINRLNETSQTMAQLGYKIVLNVPSGNPFGAFYSGGFEQGDQALPAFNTALSALLQQQNILFDMVNAGVPGAQELLGSRAAAAMQRSSARHPIGPWWSEAQMAWLDPMTGAQVAAPTIGPAPSPEQTLANLLANAPTEGAGFQHGGVVPGWEGQPRMALVHGGERVLTPEQQREGPREIRVFVEFNSGGDPFMEAMEKGCRVYARAGRKMIPAEIVYGKSGT